MRRIIPLALAAAFFLPVSSTPLYAQRVEATNGPELDNDRDSKMNRMIDGDENSFYCYRVRSRGRGTSFFIEKYDKQKLAPVFSKEVELAEDNAIVEDIKYANGNVYFFTRIYDKKTDKMNVCYQKISSSGQVSETYRLTSVKADHYEFVDIDISQNPSHTKFLVKISHKPAKDGRYTTDFNLVNIADMKIMWTKSVDGKLFSSNENAISGLTFNWVSVTFPNDIGCLGVKLDDNDNIYYSYLENASHSSGKERQYSLKLGYFPAAENGPKILDLPFDDNYWVKDIEFSQSKPGEIVVGGFLKDVIERRGRDLVKCGIFSFTIDLNSFSVKAHPVRMFDDRMLAALESNKKRSRYFKYKLDYILPVGEDVYYIGQQYKEEMVTTTTYNAGFGGSMGGSTRSSTHWDYEYMDVIVAKLNAKGEFEWIKNAPHRNAVRLQRPHVFKQYFALATPANIYIFNNDHPKNLERYAQSDYEPQDLKTVSGIHGSNFVFSSVATGNGAIKHRLIFENEKYCFAPIQERNFQFIPPADAEIFVHGAGNNIFVYTEDKGRDRFEKLVIVE